MHKPASFSPESDGSTKTSSISTMRRLSFNLHYIGLLNMLKLLKYGFCFKKSALPDMCPAEVKRLQLRSNGHNVDQLGATEISSELHGKVGDY
jgi:hypothetical protein